MSKIEKALQKARTSGVTTDGTRSLVPSGALAPVAGGRASTEVIERPDSTTSIARMRESLLIEHDELMRRGIICPELAENRTVKAFREIRTKIIQRAQGRNCVVMVASPVENGGATFVSVNLAAAFAFDTGRTALAIDCNFREPSFHRYFDVATAKGLTDFLEDKNCDISEVIHPVGVSRLRVIPAGTRSDAGSECLTSVRMKVLLDGIRSRYRDRYVLLDAAPMATTADSHILAELCDFIVVVIPYGRLTATQIDEALKGVDRHKIVGVVFNNEPHLPSLGMPPLRQYLDEAVAQVSFWTEEALRRIRAVVARKK